MEDGKISRLLGLFPPGSGKSIYSSVVFPTHFLGRFRKSMVILASYGSDLPKKFGRRARSIVKQPLYKRIFGAELSTESASVDEWVLTNTSEFMAKGILSGITGNRADGIVWDDLIKGRQDADSKQIRDTTWDAYNDDLLTRRKPTAWEVGITTRWHEDDVAGRILPINYNGESGWIKGKDGNDWYVVCLPAICEHEGDILGRKIGERLWPEWFTEKHFDSFKHNNRTWSALFQQRPAPETGDFFQADWLKPYGDGTKNPTPKRDQMHIYGASDYATTDEGGNFTVHIVVGVVRVVEDNVPKDNVYILDLWRARCSSDKWVESFCDLVAYWKPLGWAEETGQIRAGVGPFLTKRLMERRLFIARTQFPARGDKQIRAQSIRGRAAMGCLYVPHNASWFPEFKRELLNFPAGKTDDQVDSIGLIGQVLDKMIASAPITTEKRESKIISTDPKVCNVTLPELFQSCEIGGNKNRSLRIR